MSLSEQRKQKLKEALVSKETTEYMLDAISKVAIGFTTVAVYCALAVANEGEYDDVKPFITSEIFWLATAPDPPINIMMELDEAYRRTGDKNRFIRDSVRLIVTVGTTQWAGPKDEQARSSRYSIEDTLQRALAVHLGLLERETPEDPLH